MKSLYSPTWRDSMITESSTFRDAIRAIDKAGALMACVVDEKKKVLGILTDSDIRKRILAGCRLDDKMGSQYNRDPVVGTLNLSFHELIGLCQDFNVREMPLVNDQGELVDIFVWRSNHWDENLTAAPDLPKVTDPVPFPMFINAGGQGKRLAPVVSDRPKPLAEVGGKPIISTILHRAHSFGISRFFVSVHHMAAQLVDHLSDKQYAHLEIQIVRERSPLGTAGAIGLVAQQINLPLLVSNADVLTTVPYHLLLKHHLNQEADMTCAVFQHRVDVPFGVVHLDSHHHITSIREKPNYAYLVNAGIYVLSPQVCRQISQNQKLDMPDLIQSQLDLKRKIVPFLLHEYWCDIGRPADYHKANHEFPLHFGEP